VLVGDWGEGCEKALVRTADLSAAAVANAHASVSHASIGRDSMCALIVVVACGVFGIIGTGHGLALQAHEGTFEAI
jgi:hypothetical protein